MKAFLHRTSHSVSTSYEFLRSLREMSGVHIQQYGWTDNSVYSEFEIHFTADEQAELYIRLKYSTDMYEQIS